MAEMSAARAEAVKMQAERNEHEAARLDLQAQRDSTLAQLRSAEEAADEARRRSEHEKEADAMRARSLWEAELERKLSDARSEAARELRRSEAAASEALLEHRRKASADLAQAAVRS